MTLSKLIVIGGTGFIGHHLVKKAKRKGWEVTSLSLNKPKENRRIKDVNYIYSRYLDQKLFEEVFSIPYHYIVNLGGYIDHSYFSEGGNQSIIDHFDNVRKISINM